MYASWLSSWQADRYLAKMPNAYGSTMLDDYDSLIGPCENIRVLMGLYAFANEATQAGNTRRVEVSQDRLSACLKMGKATLEPILNRIERSGWFTRSARRNSMGRERTTYAMTFHHGFKTAHYSACMIRHGAFAFLTPGAQAIYALLLVTSKHPLDAVEDGFKLLWLKDGVPEGLASIMRPGLRFSDFQAVTPESFSVGIGSRLGMSASYFIRCRKELIGKGFIVSAPDVFDEALGDPDRLMLALRPLPARTPAFCAHLARFDARLARMDRAAKTFNPVRGIKGLLQAPVVPAMGGSDRTELYPDAPPWEY